MVELKIDQEFRDKIPPLTEEEFNQLRDNILIDGEIYEPIVTWNGIIIDGHNRYRIAQEHPEIPFRTKPMDFVDKWAAFEWMYRKQLGRRNLTEAQREVLIGMMYKARKNTQGGDRRSEEFSSVQKANLNGRTPRTNELLGKELGINPSSVTRAEHFADGVEEIRKVSSEAANMIMSGEAKVPKNIIRSVPQMETGEVEEIADAIVRGEAPKKRDGKWATRETRDRYDKIREIAHQMGNEQSGTTFDDVLRLLDSIENDFLAKIERTIESERVKLSEDERWPDAIDGYFDSVIADINDLKGRILK